MGSKGEELCELIMKDRMSSISSPAVSFRSDRVQSEQWNRFYIHKDMQTSEHVSDLRTKIHATLRHRARFIQVIGDSGRSFSRPGTRIVQRLFHECMQRYSDHFLLWGLTGKQEVDGSMDMNGIINAWIDEDPIRSRFAIGCVVDGGTLGAIRYHGYTIPSSVTPRRNFLIVYPDADFGGDIPTSDGLADITICFDGGIQCWHQLVNTLILGGQVIIAFGFRDTKRRFSAGMLLWSLVEASTQGSDLLHALEFYLHELDLSSDGMVLQIKDSWELIACDLPSYIPQVTLLCSA